MEELTYVVSNSLFVYILNRPQQTLSYVSSVSFDDQGFYREQKYVT